MDTAFLPPTLSKARGEGSPRSQAIAWTIVALTLLVCLGCAGSQQRTTSLGFTESSTAHVVNIIDNAYLQRQGTSAASTLLAEPVAIALDPSGNMIIGDRLTGRILKIDPDGRLLAEAPYSAPRGLSRVQAPRFVSVDLAGNVFISDASNPWVSVYDSHLRPLAELEPPYDALDLPSGTITGLAQGRFGESYLVDRRNGTVFRYDASRRFMQDFYEEGAAWTPLNRPQGAACADVDGSVYVCEPGNSQIVVFNSQGQQLNVFGGSELKEPVAIALDQHGQCFVADSAQQAIVVFTVIGRYVDLIDGPRLGLGDFGSPTDLAISDSTLNIADPSRGRILQVRFRAPATSP
jgi:DNA-binding beta-propeller fold protein YncE